MRFRFKQKYTKRELVIIGMFSVNPTVSIDAMVECSERAFGKQMSRQMAVSQIRSMSNKLAKDGYLIKRISGLGRGATGVYILTEMRK